MAYSQPVLEVPLCHLLPRPATKWYATFYATLRRQPTIRPENSELEPSYSGSFLRTGWHVPAPASIFAIPPDGTVPQRLTTGF